MDQELKQRLIGAVVVTALAAIFIPMLFDDPIDDRSQQVSELAIPPTPTASTGVEPADKAPGDAEQVINADGPEEGYVEESGAEEEPMQPIDGPDVDDESGFVEEVQTVGKAKKPAAGAKGKHAAVDTVEEDIAIENEVIDAETEAKIDAEVEKLRPKPQPKPESAAAKAGKEAAANTVKAPDANHVKPLVKPAVEAKNVAVDKATPAKKPVTTVEAVKPKTPVKQQALEKPVDDEQVLSKKPVDVAATNAEKLPMAAKPGAADAEKKTPVAKPTPAKVKTEAKRWYIQVGSFGKKENAVSLWESLRKDGFPVSLDTVQGEKGTFYRLKIGPELDGKRAVDMKARLDKHSVKSMLIAE
ncbi:MAG: SPOR domain-containing protein [Methylococcales bacterium]